MNNYYHYPVVQNQLSISSENLSNKEPQIVRPKLLRQQSEQVLHKKPQHYTKKCLDDISYKQCEQSTLNKLQKYLQHNKTQKKNCEYNQKLLKDKYHKHKTYTNNTPELFESLQLKRKEPKQAMSHVVSSSSSLSSASFESSMKNFRQNYEIDQQLHHQQNHYYKELQQNNYESIQLKYEQQSDSFSNNALEQHQEELPQNKYESIHLKYEPQTENISSSSMEQYQDNISQYNLSLRNETAPFSTIDLNQNPSTPTTQNEMAVNNISVINNKSIFCLCFEPNVYGEMINCDNANCVTGQYHFDCVNLIEPPNRPWICPICQSVELLHGIDIDF